MRRRQRTLAEALFVIAISLCVCVASAPAQSGPGALVGRRLEDVLRILQAQGLRMVFSSELVTPDMRVRVEPRAKLPRQQLTELLQPHGLAAETGPGGILQIIRAKTPAATKQRTVAAPVRQRKAPPDNLDASSAHALYRERVTVTAPADQGAEVSAGIDRQLASDELAAVRSHIADDPLRAVQVLPGVAAGDDFRSEYSVRGSAYRHAGIVIDGVIAPWLQHAAFGLGDTGTMTMLRGDLVQEARLLVGAYPRVDSGQIGPQLSLMLREGSRASRRVQLGVSGSSATLTAEGPIGSSSRGSWLVGVRRSHSEWPASRSDEDSTVFGFGDVQSKVAYDVHPGQQVSLSLVAGLSDVEREDSNPFALASGLNRAAMLGMAWRSVIGEHTVVTQRISTLTHDFRNRNQQGEPGSRGANGAHAYRADLRQSLFRGVVEAGGQVRRVRGSRHASTPSGTASEVLFEPTVLADSDPSWLERSAHASFRRALGPVVTLAAGFRLADSTLIDHSALDRWIQVEWSLAPRWLLHGSTGVMHQFPAIEQAAGWLEPSALRPERALYVDLGIGHRLSRSLHWDATVFARRERDTLREPDLHPRLIDDVLDVNGNVARFENALIGRAHGVEVTIARRSQTGLSGWVGYTFGTAQYVDPIRQETFPADFDQRHAINMSGTTALPWRAKLGFTFRGGTNFPVPGYFVRRDGQLFAGGARNRERLPAYARLDIRTERTFEQWGRRFTVFAEALNVLNRVNLGPTDGAIVRDTGHAVGFTERLFPRLLTAGLRLEF